MKYIKCFEKFHKFNFDELAILSNLEKAILHLIRIHEEVYYGDTKISDTDLFRNDIKDLLQKSITDRKDFKLNPRKYPHNPDFLDGVTSDHILSTLSDYQIGIYGGEDRLSIDDKNIDNSLKLELDLLLSPLKKREDGILSTTYYLIDLKRSIDDAIRFDKDGVYKRMYKD